MKKIYMLLAMALLGITSAMAGFVPSADYSNARLTPEGAKALRARYEQSRMPLANAYNVNSDLETMTRSYTNGYYQYVFQMTLDHSQTWSDVLAFGSEDDPVYMTFEELPLYVVWFQMTIIDIRSGLPYAFIPQFGMWPCYYWWTGEVYDNPDMPEEERNYDAVTPTDLCNDMSLCHKFKEKYLEENGNLDLNPYVNADGDFDYWLIMNQDMMIAITPEDASLSYQSNGDGTFKYTGTTLSNSSRASSIEFNSFDNDTQEINFKYQIYAKFTTATGSLQSKNFGCTYVGTSSVNGWEKRNVTYPIAELHIFNGGECGTEVLGAASDPYLQKWGPLRRYYVYGMGNDLFNMYYMNDTNVFDSELVMVRYREDVPNEDQFNTDNQTYFYGALYSDMASTEPKDVWTILKPTYTFDPNWGLQMDFYPQANTAIPAYQDISEEQMKEAAEYGWGTPRETYSAFDGFIMFLRTYGQIMNGGTKICNGSVDGFWFAGQDTYENTVKGNFNGEYYYHADPNDCQKYELKTTIGDLANVNEAVVSNNTVTAANGKINVTCEENANVVIYNLNGQALYNTNLSAGENATVALPNGLYIVKAGKEIHKVIL